MLRSGLKLWLVGILALNTLLVSNVPAQSFVQEAYIKASNTDAFDNFGRSIAASGSTVIVGAPSERSAASGVDGNQADNSLTGAGAAYIFVRDASGMWSQQAYLKASDPSSNAQFGWSVAISGDTAVVGALAAGGLQTGVAYVFVRDGTGTWSQQARLTPANAEFDDQFGIAVGVSGDRIVVGANREDSAATTVGGNGADNSASEAGAAYVFVRNGSGVWSEQAYLKASNTAAIDNFGQSVAISGDTVVVGSNDQAGDGGGAAFVFVDDGAGNWSQQAKLDPSNGESGDQFTAVAISGETIVVGASGEDSNVTGIDGDGSNNDASFSGAAYVFTRDGMGSWSEDAYLKASNTDAFDNFGIAVSIAGDRVLVGANGEASNATGINGDGSNNALGLAGAAYVFERSMSGDWSQAAYVKASNTDGGDQFGISVGISDSLVAVGALRERSSATGINGDGSDNGFAFSGAAYAYVAPPSADVGAEFLLCTDRAEPEAPFRYGLRVVNAGPESAEGVALTHSTLAGAIVVAVSSPDCVASGTTVDCDFGTLALGDVREVGFDVLAPAGGAQILTMSAETAASTSDPALENNTEVVEIQQVPGLVIADSFEACGPMP